MTYIVGLIGGQFGDEGKGKIVSALAPRADIVARWAGGNNAGHTIVKDGKKHAVHLLPSGVFYPNVTNIMGRSMLVDPLVLVSEIDKVHKEGFEPELYIAAQAHVITDWHKKFDEGYEKKSGKGKIGTTGRGIGPCAEAKANRNQAVRIEDLVRPKDELEKKFIDTVINLAPRIVEMHPDFERFISLGIDQTLKPQGELRDALESYALSQAEAYNKAGERIKRYVSKDITTMVNNSSLKFVLCEGAQGIMLNADQGTFPYVTSTDTGVGGCITSLGISPHKISDVIAVVKAYETRVGGGPFATELNDDIGESLRKEGNEYGTTTGRPRRCGWLNGTELMYVVRQQGIDWIALTKLDVLDICDEIRIGYEKGGSIEYKSFKGWKKSIKNCRHFDELPLQTQEYVMAINFIAPLAMISVGPEDTDTIYMPNFVAHLKKKGIDLENSVR